MNAPVPRDAEPAKAAVAESAGRESAAEEHDEVTLMLTSLASPVLSILAISQVATWTLGPLFFGLRFSGTRLASCLPLLALSLYLHAALRDNDPRRQRLGLAMTAAFFSGIAFPDLYFGNIFPLYRDPRMLALLAAIFAVALWWSGLPASNLLPSRAPPPALPAGPPPAGPSRDSRRGAPDDPDALRDGGG